MQLKAKILHYFAKDEQRNQDVIRGGGSHKSPNYKFSLEKHCPN